MLPVRSGGIRGCLGSLRSLTHLSLTAARTTQAASPLLPQIGVRQLTTERREKEPPKFKISTKQWAGAGATALAVSAYFAYSYVRTEEIAVKRTGDKSINIGKVEGDLTLYPPSGEKKSPH